MPYAMHAEFSIVSPEFARMHPRRSVERAGEKKFMKGMQ